MRGRKKEADKGDFNVTRLDSKGRVTIPFPIRAYMDLKDGSEFLVVNNENREIRIFPLLKGKIAYFRAIISDNPGSLSRLLDTIAKYDVDIISSASKTLERGKTAEWTAIVDIAMCKNVRRIEQELSGLSDVIKKVEIIIE